MNDHKEPRMNPPARKYVLIGITIGVVVVIAIFLLGRGGDAHGPTKYQVSSDTSGAGSLGAPTVMAPLVLPQMDVRSTADFISYLDQLTTEQIVVFAKKYPEYAADTVSDKATVIKYASVLWSYWLVADVDRLGALTIIARGVPGRESSPNETKAQTEVIKSLLEKGANPDSGYQGSRPLDDAATLGKADLVGVLLDANATWQDANVISAIYGNIRRPDAIKMRHICEGRGVTIESMRQWIQTNAPDRMQIFE